MNIGSIPQKPPPVQRPPECAWARVCVRIVTGLLIFGFWKFLQALSRTLSNPAKSYRNHNPDRHRCEGAQALRAAGQPVVAGLVLRNGAPHAPASLDGRNPWRPRRRQGIAASNAVRAAGGARSLSVYYNLENVFQIMAGGFGRAPRGAAALTGVAAPGIVRPRRGRLQSLAPCARLAGWARRLDGLPPLRMSGPGMVVVSRVPGWRRAAIGLTFAKHRD